MEEKISEKIKTDEYKELSNHIMNDNNIIPKKQLEIDIKKSCGCGSNSTMSIESEEYIYVLGKVIHVFPNKGLEEELRQAIGRKPEEETKGLTNPEVASKFLTDPNYRYINRQLCWVLNIENVETYVLLATDSLDIDRFAEALRPVPGNDDIDLIIGRKGPFSNPKMCNGLIIPTLLVDRIYSFSKEEILKDIPKRKGINEQQFRKTADNLFSYVIQLADNAGATDEQRALNYLSVRYDEIYYRTYDKQIENYSFSRIEIRQSRLSGARKIVDVIFSYENRNSAAIERWFTRVDVTDEFPFIVSPLQQYFER